MATDQVVVSPLLQVVCDKLANLLQKDFDVVWGVQKEMKKLSKALCKIQNVLIDAEDKQANDLEIRNWLKELKDVAYSADDIMEEWAFEGLLQVVPETSNNTLVTKVTDSLKGLIENFDDIAKESREFDLQKGVVEQLVKISPGRETSSFLTEPQVYGREKDKENLVRLLLGQYSSRPTHPTPPRANRPLAKKVNSLELISVCPIVGMGGLGKTTLAQLVYNDKRIVEHFNVRSWVCVSEDFDVKRLIRTIITSTSGNTCSYEELDPLQLTLQEELRGKRFLLVLDDVWEKNLDDWNKLIGPLSCGVQGSCVIVTTRLKTVSSITGTIRRYRLRVLSEEDCWALFKQHAFGLENDEKPELLKIGKDIVKKCGGVPLAAKALGGLMRFKREPREWLSVRDSKIWELPQNNILPALRLSYNHLPSHLRQCFTYCSIFPKDSEVNRKQLIQLWMANDFLQSKGRMELEDVGNEIFEALLWRSFFQDIVKDKDGNIETCKMHDLVHDLACHIADDECSMVDVSTVKNVSRRTRHVSLFFSEETASSMFCSISKFPSCLRSLSFMGNTEERRALTKDSQFIFSHFIHLRALDLSRAFVQVLPNSIGNMKHLRFLNLSYNYIKSLPESICELRNVETLNLSWSFDLQTLPKNMREMSSLRHLDLSGFNHLTEMPIGMGKLTYLQTLSLFIVGLEDGRGINELQGLNIRGDLKIRQLEHVKNSMDAKEANLMKMEDLCSLELSWSLDCQLQGNAAEEVLKGLEPHRNLRRFTVERYQGVCFPSWLTGSSLPKLVEISLSSCIRCEHLPPLKTLPLLKVLRMNSLDSVKFIDEDNLQGSGGGVTGFLSLEGLELDSMPSLLGWSPSPQGGGGNQQAAATKLLFPCLKILTLERCPKLMGVPLPSSLQSVKITKCNDRVLGSLQNLPNLSSLEIWWFDEMVCFPEGALQNLSALQKLKISHCRELVSLPEEFRNTSSLTSLYIDNCFCLKRLPDLEKSSLVDLAIMECLELQFSVTDFQHLVVLQGLRLINLPKLAHFPEGLKHAVMLQEIYIHLCSQGVMDLPDWIGTLTSLHTLCIHGCKNRKMLPEGLQLLTALQLLQIDGCDAELEKRCKKDKGEEWSKISHVPVIRISS